MIRLAILLIAAVCAVSAFDLINRPKALTSTKSWQQRFRGYPELLDCRQQLVLIDYSYTKFFDAQISPVFRFYTFSTETINLKLVSVPARPNDLYASELFQIDIADKLVSIQSGTVKEDLPAKEALLLGDEPNEVRIELLGGRNVSIIVNEVQFDTQIGVEDVVKAFRYVSFSMSPETEVQEYFFNCDPLPPKPEQPETEKPEKPETQPEPAQSGHASQPEEKEAAVPRPNAVELE